LVHSKSNARVEGAARDVLEFSRRRLKICLRQAFHEQHGLFDAALLQRREIWDVAQSREYSSRIDDASWSAEARRALAK
jgi:hypothetical protein